MNVQQAMRRIDKVLGRTIAGAAALATAASVHAQGTLYVDDDAPAGGDGSSWATAFRDLQSALAAARVGGSRIGVIKVAAGIYAPAGSGGDRGATFLTVSGVALEGGFAGLGAVGGGSPDEQDPDRFVSVLTGDLNGDDGPGFTSRSDNAKHVVTVSGFSGIELDGFTIRGGYADEDASYGGAVRVSFTRAFYAYAYQDLLIRRCVFAENHAFEAGGALGHEQGSTSLEDCRFMGNRAGRQGGAAWGSLSVVRCLFEGNEAPLGGAVSGVTHAVNCRFVGNSAVAGGAVHGLSVLSACSLMDNFAVVSGGAVHSPWDMSRWSDCLFAGNRAETGGAVHAHFSSQIERCTIAGNTAEVGGGVVSATGYLRITDSILWGNAAPSGGGPQAAVGLHASLSVDRCILAGGMAGIRQDTPGRVHATRIDPSNPRFVDAVGADGDPFTARDNDYRPQADSPAIDGGVCYLTDLWKPELIDAIGQPRFGPRPCITSMCADLGAIEYQSPVCTDAPVAIHVRSNAPLGGDGRSWATAFRTLNEGVRSAWDRPIWVAGGVYRATGRDDTLIMIPDNAFGQVRRHIIGGFAGTETDASQRVAVLNSTVLDGDVLGNDDGSAGARGDNARRVIQGGSTDLLLEDLTIRNMHGGNPALLFYGPLLTMRRVVIENSSADTSYSGTVLFQFWRGVARLESVTVRNCVAAAGPIVSMGSAARLEMHGGTFESNTSSVIVRVPQSAEVLLDGTRFAQNRGIAMGATLAGEVVVSDCEFIANTRSTVVAQGAALLIESGPASIVRSKFIRNRATATGSSSSRRAEGGAVYSTGRLTIADCLFAGNEVVGPNGSGGAAVCATQPITMTNCTIVGNKNINASTGGAVWLSGVTGPSLVTSSILWDNEMVSGQGAESQIKIDRAQGGAADLVRRSIIEGWVGPDNDDVSGDDPRFVDPLGPDGVEASGDENFALRSDSPAIDRASDLVSPAGDCSPDIGDADGDGSTSERTPVDLASHPRVVRARGLGAAFTLDLGAYEFQQVICAADWNGVGGLTVQDLLEFVGAWLGGDADFNGSGETSVQDIFDYLVAYFAGCA